MTHQEEVNNRLHRFHRIINESLPKRLEMMNVLVKNAISTEGFYRKGSGLQAVLDETGRVDDFMGIYAFVRKGQPVFIDESAYVLKRIIRHFKGSNKYQQKLAYIIATRDYGGEGAIHSSLVDMEKMRVAFMDIPDDLERKLTVLYFQAFYKCEYNISADLL